MLEPAPAVLLLLAGCAAGGVAGGPSAAEPPTPRALNARELPTRSAGERWSFLLGGHLYGDVRTGRGLAATVVGARALLDDPRSDLLFAAGDTFRSCAEPWLSETLAFFAGVRLPVFNAPGNHDLAWRAEYERRFAPLWGAFVHGGCLFVQVDTETVPWEIAGEQLAFLRRTLREAAARADVRAVFCVGHKLVFSHRRRYFALLLGANAHDGLALPNRFGSDVLPLLAEVAEHKPVYWCGGDIGTGRSLPLFFDRDPTSGVHFVALGCGDRPEDLLLRVEVVAGAVAFEPLRIGTAPPPTLAEHGLEAWNERFRVDDLPPAVAAFRDRLPE